MADELPEDRRPNIAEPTVRLVHLADLHLQPERDAPVRMDRALARVRSLTPPADAILLGGDVVMNTVGVDLARAMTQWNLWTEVRKTICIPIFPCIGNQDCWGWNQKASGCTGKEPLFGKAMAMHQLEMRRSYYLADIGAWRLIVLDSVHQGGKHGFMAELDPPQKEWGADELARSEGEPVVIMSHVQIVAGPADLFSSHILQPSPSGV